jgi:hypothetical protein
MEDTERSATINAVNALIPQFEYLYNLWAVKPSDPDALELNAMLKRWVDCGAWDEWDLVYVPSIHDQDAGDVDWTNGGPFSLDRFGGLVWTAFEGYTGNSTDAYLLTNWVAISHAVHYENKGDDASFMVFSLTDDPNNGGDIFGAKSRLSLTPNGQAVEGLSGVIKLNFTGTKCCRIRNRSIFRQRQSMNLWLYWRDMMQAHRLIFLRGILPFLPLVHR